jgi:transposase
MDKRVKHQTEPSVAADRLFDVGFGVSYIATNLSISRYTIRDWQTSYRQGRLLGLGAMSGNNRYSHTLKVAAVEKFLAGKAKADVLAEFGITSRAVLNKWVAAYRADGVLGLVDKPKGRKPRGKDPSSQSLEERIYHWDTESAVLKKFHALMDEQKALNKKRGQ